MLTQLEITSREPVLDGKSFGAVGPYETLLGSAQFAVDPNHVLNRPIADLGLAPVDAQGHVTFRAEVYLLKPVVPSRGNGNVFYHVVNRGRKNLLTVFNLAGGANLPTTAAQFGDEFLMREGYVVAACGWQADVPPEAPDNPDLMTLDVPVIHGVTGPVGCEIVVDDRVKEHSLGSRYHIPYEVANENDPNAVLTVRAYPYDEPEVIARDRWSLGRLADGRPSIRFSEGFEPGLIYNLVYTGKDPCVMGLGLAATRDFLSFLKYEEREENPLCEGLGALPIERVYSFGSSQSGRFLRHLLYLGFNQDEAGRQVMDGVMANVAGGARGSFNHRFAQPSRHSSGHTDVFYPTEQFPFNDLPQADSVTGETGGLLDRCEAQGVTPRIFYTNTSTEYWNRGASLVHTDVGGTQDVVLPECVRVYHFASTQHGPGEIPAGARQTWPPNPVNFRYVLRALLVAMD
ncbi:MAG: alpha/beta hydrolase domain-containing protein, partial [bacterium]|nr:alpha/beta hydrolase domain-containing protein [bacterium]